MLRSPGFFALLSLTLLASAGCQGEGVDTVAFNDLAAAETDAYCSYFVECDQAVSYELCVDVWDSFSPYLTQIGAAIDNGTVVYDASAAGECLDAIKNTSCREFPGDVDPPGSCERIFEGTIADGDRCWVDAQCMSERCDESDCAMSCCEGTCAPEIPRAAVGEDCSEAFCESGAFCDFEVRTCVEYKAEGEACSSPFECASALICVDETCRPLSDEGEPCVELGCVVPLECDIDSMTCAPLRAEGEPCNPDFSICRVGLSCDVESNTCALPADIGSPCQSTFSGCTSGAFCALDPETGQGTCQALVANGEACTVDSACQSVYCGDDQTCEALPVCVQ